MDRLAVISVIAVVFLLILIFPWASIYVGSISVPDLDLPEITHAEFPFELTYVLNGEQITIQDTLICDYAGTTAYEIGKYRQWTSRCASGKSRITLLRLNETDEIYYTTISAKDLMGDWEGDTPPDHTTFSKNACIIERVGETGYHDGILFADELLVKYGIQIINWECAAPIKNSFAPVQT